MKKCLFLLLCSIYLFHLGQAQTARSYKSAQTINKSDDKEYKNNAVFKGTLAEARQNANNYDTVIISDYGGGIFYLDANDHTTADNTGTIFVTKQKRRFKRKYEGPILPDWFGVYGDGLDHVAALQDLFNGDIDNKTISFSSGIYIVANDSVNLVVKYKKSLKVSGNGNTIFSNLAGNGGSGGANIVFDSCQNVEFSGIKTLDLNQTRWSCFNNLLVFISCKNVKIYNNYFGAVSNKHIHLGGNDDDIEIYNNLFENAGYNVNPLTQNTFASIYLYLEGQKDQRLQNISIHDNKFKNNAFFCISAGNYNIATNNGFENVFSNVSVQNNIIDSCGGAFIMRVNGGKIIGNTIMNTGFANLTRNYIYVDSLHRYYSKTRLKYSPSPASHSNTTTPLSGAAIVIGGSINTIIKDNNFFGGLVAQNVVLAGGVQPCAYIIGASNRQNIITNNNFTDTINGTTWIPHILFNNNPVDLNIASNNFLIPKSYAGPFIIKVNNGKLNKAYFNNVKQQKGRSTVEYAGTLYNGIIPTSKTN